MPEITEVNDEESDVPQPHARDINEDPAVDPENVEEPDSKSHRGRSIDAKLDNRDEHEHEPSSTPIHDPPKALSHRETPNPPSPPPFPQAKNRMSTVPSPLHRHAHPHAHDISTHHILGPLNRYINLGLSIQHSLLTLPIALSPAGLRLNVALRDLREEVHEAREVVREVEGLRAGRRRSRRGVGIGNGGQRDDERDGRMRGGWATIPVIGEGRKGLWGGRGMSGILGGREGEVREGFLDTGWRWSGVGVVGEVVGPLVETVEKRRRHRSHERGRRKERERDKDIEKAHHTNPLEKAAVEQVTQRLPQTLFGEFDKQERDAPDPQSYPHPHPHPPQTPDDLPQGPTRKPRRSTTTLRAARAAARNAMIPRSSRAMREAAVRREEVDRREMLDQRRRMERGWVPPAGMLEHGEGRGLGGGVDAKDWVSRGDEKSAGGRGAMDEKDGWGEKDGSDLSSGSGSGSGSLTP